MKILLTLDYELFLGKATGSIENCLIKPMEQLCEITDKYGVKFTIFVDATYLLRLSQLKEKHASLLIDYQKVCSHILFLKEKGHDIELHIHPNWIFSEYCDNKWVLDNNYYRLSELPHDKAIAIFTEAKAVLENIIGDQVFAFRAGGYSTQPFSILKECFEKNNILLDSSVVPGNVYKSSAQYYDYRDTPSSSIYNFDEDICVESVNGQYTELPLAVKKNSPFFSWKLLLNRILKQTKHRSWGDGQGVVSNNVNIIKRLIKYTYAYATIDDYKSSYLTKVFKRSLKSFGEDGYFTVIGHPKLATPYSVKKLENFIKTKQSKHEFITTKDLHLR